jgi:ElaB/YqjD/DUF883 family membrane-anchored ribosome-binding protein
MEKQFEITGAYAKPEASGLDQFKHTVAQKLSNAADALHQQTARVQQPSDLSRFGEKAADWLESSADYVSAMEPQKLKDDLAMQVRRNPGRSLLIVGAAGLILGKLLRRR